MIHWTRQIKEVLSAQEALETAESSGPLEEIDFWNNRCIDLSGKLKTYSLNFYLSSNANSSFMFLRTLNHK